MLDRDGHGAPDWFVEAVADEGHAHSVSVAGENISYRVWGDETAPVLVLVHGGAAHARWWSAHAPLLARTHRVAAVDLSGHGDSSWRDAYDPHVWADEVMAVAEAAGGIGKPVVVGHSMGGFVTVVTAARNGADLEGAIILDTPIRREDPESDDTQSGKMVRSPKVYADMAEAIAHFRLVPPQPCDNPWLLDYTAQHSVREAEVGWTWKFDPNLLAKRVGARRAVDFAPLLARAACKFAVINGELSDLVDASAVAAMQELLADSPAAAGGVPFVEIPAARHHLLFDQPLATVSAIRAVLATWHPVGAQPADIQMTGE